MSERREGGRRRWLPRDCSSAIRPGTVRAARVDQGRRHRELKLSVPLSNRSKAGAALGVDPLDGEIRQVYFFDTPDLTLNKSGVVVRARRVQRKGDDSVVKLRPSCPTSAARAALSENFGVEVDAMPGGYVCSGSMKHAMGPTEVRQAVTGTQPVQQAVLQGAESALCRACSRRDRARRPLDPRPGARAASSSSRRKSMAAGSSPSCGSTQTTRCCSSCRRNARPPRHSRSPPRQRAFLTGHGIDLSGEQETKTKKALEFFSQQLQGTAD